MSEKQTIHEIGQYDESAEFGRYMSRRQQNTEFRLGVFSEYM
jgi:hypothetical protein